MAQCTILFRLFFFSPFALRLTILTVSLRHYAISRPGILVLVNETDWELLGGNDATLNNGDEIVFISTLHGG